MNRLFILVMMLVASSFVANADYDTNQLQDQLRREYGSCYDEFADNLASCKKSTCTYPDLTTAKSWKTQVINGMVDKKCYVMYYSFMGETITSNPDHCFYDRETVETLYTDYKKLFKSGSAVDIMALKGKINYLSYQGCKKREEEDKGK